MGRVKTGKAVRWNDERGFGFIESDDGGPDVFVHRSALNGGDDRSTRLEEGDKVEYEEVHDKNGKMCAGNVEVVSGGGGKRRDSSRPRGRKAHKSKRGRRDDDSRDDDYDDDDSRSPEPRRGRGGRGGRSRSRRRRR